MRVVPEPSWCDDPACATRTFRSVLVSATDCPVCQPGCVHARLSDLPFVFWRVRGFAPATPCHKHRRGHESYCLWRRHTHQYFLQEGPCSSMHDGDSPGTPNTSYLAKNRKHVRLEQQITGTCPKGKYLCQRLALNPKARERWKALGWWSVHIHLVKALEPLTASPLATEGKI
jgi:hypothetical protein